MHELIFNRIDDSHLYECEICQSNFARFEHKISHEKVCLLCAIEIAQTIAEHLISNDAALRLLYMYKALEMYSA